MLSDKCSALLFLLQSSRSFKVNASIRHRGDTVRFRSRVGRYIDETAKVAVDRATDTDG